MHKTFQRSDMRSELAYLAARIMVEDGIEDYATAKRKAARQAGVGDTRQLPGNDEIDVARASYQQLFRADEQHDRLIELRETAVRAMQELEAFDPHLTGAVLHGGAGKYAGIELQLFTDDAKAVELFLIGKGIDYQPGQRRLYCGEVHIIAPTYTVNDDGTDIDITVLSRREVRAPLKTSPAGKAIERARLPAVEELLANTC